MKELESSGAYKKLDRKAKLKLWGGVAVNLALALALSWYVSHANAKSFEALFQREASLRGAAIRGELEQNAGLVRLAGDFVRSSNLLDARQFSRFASGMMSSAGSLLALAWSPRVPAAGLAAWREAAGRQGGGPMRVWTGAGTPPGRGLKAGRDCFPVRFLVSRSGLGKGFGIKGLDLSSLEGVGRAMAAARDGGELASTGRMRLPGAGGMGSLVLNFWPVYGREQNIKTRMRRRSLLTGFVVGMYSIKSAVSRGASLLAPAGLDILVTDLSASPDTARSFFHVSRPGGNGHASQEPPGKKTGDLSWQDNMLIGGRSWGVEVFSTAAFMARKPLWQNRLVFAASLLLAFLLTWLFYSQLLRSEKTRALLEERAAELGAARDEAEIFYRTAPSPYFVCDENRLVTRFNLQMSRLSGYEPDELQGLCCQKLFDCGQGRDCIILAQDEKACPASQECRLITKDGRLVEVIKNCGLLRDAGGRVSGALAMMQDISEQKRVLDRTRASGERFRQIISRAFEGFWTLDEKSLLIKDVNQAFCKMLGYEPEELLGRFAGDLIAPEALKNYQRNLERTKANGQGSYQTTFMSKDGRRIEAGVSAAVLRDEKGGPGETFAFVRDIAEFQNAQRLAEGQADKLAGIISTMEQGVLFFDQDGMLMEINGYMCRFMGLERLKVLGRSLHELDLGDRSIIEEVESVFSDPRKQAKNIQRPIGGAEVIIRAQPVFTSGVYQGVMVHLTDVTGMVAARRAAEKASQAKSDFLANITHEIRTPLNGVIGLTNLVLESDLGAEQRESLELVKDSAHSLLAMIDHILDFSSMEAGKLDINHLRFDFHRLINGTVDSLAPLAREKGLGVQSLISAEVPQYMVGDPKRLAQVLKNLLDNGIKFTDQGYVKVEAKVLRRAPGRVVMGLAVKDTGIGIRRDKLRKLFRAFEQGDPSATRRHGGVGLGLAVCSSLVKLMGGDIWAESRAGGGSEFHFSIPLGLDQRDSKGTALGFRGGAKLSRLPSPAKSRRREQGLNILVAEDNPVNLNLMTKVLTRWGHQVVTASDGREALAAVAREKFDLVLMDLQMPLMDGIEATKKIRKREPHEGHRLPIAALTGWTMPENREQCLRAGMDGYLSKPVDNHELEELIASLTGWRRKKNPPPPPPRSGKERLADIAERFEGDLELARRVVETFLDEEPRLFAAVAQAAAKNDPPALTAAAHTLKGSVSYMNFDRAREICLDLENLGKSGKLEEAAGLVEDLESALAQLRRRLSPVIA